MEGLRGAVELYVYPLYRDLLICAVAKAIFAGLAEDQTPSQNVNHYNQSVLRHHHEKSKIAKESTRQSPKFGIHDLTGLNKSSLGVRFIWH